MFAVPCSRFLVRVLVLGSVLVLSSGFGSEFGLGSAVPHTAHGGPNLEQNLEPNLEHEQGTANPEQRTPGSEEYWCPMHPNARGASGEKCSECGMALVPIPDRTDTTYWLEVVAQPAAVPVGKPVKLQVTVRERPTNAAVTHFDQIHERTMHLFVVSGDLQYFDHVHPAPQQDGSFTIPLTLPKAGAYRLVADLLPTGGLPQTLQHTLLTAGASIKPTRSPAPPNAEVLEAVSEDVRARIVTGGARTGDDAHVVVELVDARSGAAVTDLEPYLGAWGHMFLASVDLADVVHSHPLIADTVEGGPKITFQTLFARAGWYRVWTQVQRRGRLLRFDFTVRVAPAL